jgi:hypothetical protein
MEGIGILQKIFAQDKLPTNIMEWYEQVSKHNSHYRVQEILSQRHSNTSKAQTTNYVKKPFTP